MARAPMARQPTAVAPIATPTRAVATSAEELDALTGVFMTVIVSGP